jgi:tetratricopeptide (TPR) repeat protein
VAIEGPLKELGIHDVFQLLDLSRKTGVLRVRSEIRQNAGMVYFEKGAVIGAEIRSNPHPLGGLLLRAGKVSEEDLTRARAMQQNGDPRRLGEVLIHIGSIGRRELDRQVRAQIEEVVFELLSWSEGYFSFEEGEVNETPAEADVRITTEALVMEAARRIDEWSRIETKIPHLGIIPRLAPPANDGPLDLIPFEWEVLTAIDGSSDVRGLAITLGKSEFEVAKTLFGLTSAGILSLDDPISERRDHAGGRELAMLIARAENELLTGTLEAARQIAEEAVTVHPDQPLSHVVLGRVLLASGRFADAGVTVHKALQLDPDCVTAWRLWGICLAAQGRFREATEACDRWNATSGMSPEEASHAATVRAVREAAATIDGALRGARE